MMSCLILCHAIKHGVIMSLPGLSRLIAVATHVSPATGREIPCLDHTWHSLSATCISNVTRPGLSDRYPVSCVFDANMEKYL